MKHLFSLLCCTLALVLAGCTAEPSADNGRCIKHASPHYDAALAKQLTKTGVKHAVTDKGICVKHGDAARYDAAAAELDKYFGEVAALLKDECEERALVEWARKEGIIHEVKATQKPNSSPGPKMIVLRSFNADEVKLNKLRLANDAPKGVSCEGVKVG
jgi:hypothetical protein